MNHESSDRLEAVEDQNFGSLYIRATGIDRPNLIASVTKSLDDNQLYVSAMVFSLQLPFLPEHPPGAFPYHMEIEAKGPSERMKLVHDQIREGRFIESAPVSCSQGPLTAWFASHHFHLAVLTPDRAGITASLSKIVGRTRKNENGQDSTGNFVHLTATTLNDGGPHGGTPYFKLRANVAVDSEKVMREIQEELDHYARQNGMVNEVKWILLE